MTIVVIVIARPAAHLRRFGIDQGYDCVIGDAATLDAVIVDDVA